MNKIYIVLFFFVSSTIIAQNTFTALVKDKDHKEVLVGVNVTITNTKLGGSTDEFGVVEIHSIPNGLQEIVFTYVGFEEKRIRINFPLTSTERMEIFLEGHEEEHEEVIVSATRSSRTIADNPTRVEAISGEELGEKGNMKPGDIRMLLNESTGIQTQQTSAISFNSSIRIQGLDGKYTQILKDGYPLYAGFSGGLSLLQIVPLDLKQVEVIKGSSSTLYGAGAIAGLVNLVSKGPSEEREISSLINLTSAKGLDASSFYSNKFGDYGTTIFASYNRSEAYDPADNGLTAIPEFERFTLNPKLFYDFDDKTQIHFGLSMMLEDRKGGDIAEIENPNSVPNAFIETNETTRFSANFAVEHQQSDDSRLSLKNTISYYDRKVAIPDYIFSGDQLSTFSELSYSFKDDNFDWIVGLNLWKDRFSQNKPDSTAAVDYDFVTVGAFVQNLWKISDKMSLETGLRYDYHNEFASFFLPRTSLLYKVDSELSFRLGGGMGYKSPTVFTEDAERLQFRNVLPIDLKNTKAEESYGLNADINYRTAFLEEFTFSINNLLFYTRINDPLILNPTNLSQYQFEKANGYIDTKGLESNIKFTYDHYKLFIGYTYADVNEHYDGKESSFPLVAKHRLNNVLMYEKHDDFRIGLEAYYFSPQKRNDGSTGKEYWIMGLMTEKSWEDFSLFLNFENFLDTRQTKFEKIYSGPITNPVFNDIYAPIDGFVINGGVKIKF